MSNEQNNMNSGIDTRSGYASESTNPDENGYIASEEQSYSQRDESNSNTHRAILENDESNLNTITTYNGSNINTERTEDIEENVKSNIATYANNIADVSNLNVFKNNMKLTKDEDVTLYLDEHFQGSYFISLRNISEDKLTDEIAVRVAIFILNDTYINPKLHSVNPTDPSIIFNAFSMFFKDRLTSKRFLSIMLIYFRISGSNETNVETVISTALNDIGSNLFLETKIGKLFINDCLITENTIELPALYIKSFSLLPYHYHYFDENGTFKASKYSIHLNSLESKLKEN